MAEKKVRVGIVMGSDSDWEKINGVAKALDEFNVGYEIHVMSAHRTPDKVLAYASAAKERGLGVIIAAAGGAAHLAGVCASHTILPVIGIPVEGGALNGMDALLATVQMPGGIPVATVGVGSGGATNAALLAVQILALNDAALAERFAADRAARRQKVLDADEAMMKEYGN